MSDKEPLLKTSNKPSNGDEDDDNDNGNDKQLSSNRYDLINS
jgi:hypothetical protein